MEADLLTVAQSVGSAVLFSLVYFAKNRRRKAQSFDYVKFGSTLLVGLLVGVAMALSGIDVTQVSFETEIAAYTGLIALLDAAISAVLKGESFEE